jgi:flagellar hook-basal body complex protein FliE
VAIPIAPVASTPTITPAAPAASKPAAAGFGESLGRLLESAGESSDSANAAVGQMLNGTGDVHEAMIALQRAELSLQLTVQVRNKIVQAYQDIMRMPV